MLTDRDLERLGRALRCHPATTHLTCGRCGGPAPVSDDQGGAAIAATEASLAVFAMCRRCNGRAPTTSNGALFDLHDLPALVGAYLRFMEGQAPPQDRWIAVRALDLLEEPNALVVIDRDDSSGTWRCIGLAPYPFKDGDPADFMASADDAAAAAALILSGSECFMVGGQTLALIDPDVLRPNIRKGAML